MQTSTIISVITLLGVLIAILTNVTSLIGKRESKAASDARVEVKLDNIYTKVDSIDKRQYSQECTLQTHGERITVVEQSTKQAHLRVDRIEKENNKD